MVLLRASYFCYSHDEERRGRSTRDASSWSDYERVILPLVYFSLDSVREALSLKGIVFFGATAFLWPFLGSGLLSEDDTNLDSEI